MKMTVVSAEEFFALLKADPRDIMPRHAYPDYTTWEDQRTRQVVGRSLPGWRNPGEPKVYMLQK
jgi:hypothetical protein